MTAEKGSKFWERATLKPSSHLPLNPKRKRSIPFVSPSTCESRRWLQTGKLLAVQLFVAIVFLICQNLSCTSAILPRPPCSTLAVVGDAHSIVNVSSCTMMKPLKPCGNMSAIPPRPPCSTLAVVGDVHSTVNVSNCTMMKPLKPCGNMSSVGISHISVGMLP